MDKLPQPHLVQRLSEKRSASKKYTGIDQDFSLDYMGSTEFETGSAFRAQKGWPRSSTAWSSRRSRTTATTRSAGSSGPRPSCRRPRSS